MKLEAKIECQPGKLPEVICAGHPGWAAIYNTAWRMAFSNIEYPDNPAWKPQMSCMPGSGKIWQWDSCFMTLFSRFSNQAIPVMNNLDNLYRLQREDGYLSMAYSIETEKEAYGQRINPPLFAWVEWEYYQVTGDASRFDSVLPKLIRYYDWIKTNRTRVSGLYWFEDSGSSGMDNSPRNGYAARDLAGSDVCFVDLACQQALSALYLGKIAGLIGLPGIVTRFCEEHFELCRMINKYHWSEKAGFYFDLFSRSEKKLRHNYLNHKTLAALWGVISGVADENQVTRLAEHLFNPKEFWTLHPLPSLSWDDPNYDPHGNYWLGGVWCPTNYMVIKGLAQRGRFEAAQKIALKHLNAMVEVMQNDKYASIWESYAPEYMQPANKYDYNAKEKTVRPNFVGWSGLGPIAVLIEHILGFDFNANENQISWRISVEGEHGVRNLFFNRKLVSLICRNRQADSGKVTVVVDTTGEINLNCFLVGNRRECRYKLKAGRHELDLS